MKKTEKKITAKQKEKWLEAIRGNDIETIKRIIKEGININIQNEFGETALHYTCFYNRIEMTNLLIENGADVNAQDRHGWTPLHRACSYASYGGNTEMAKFLIENGVDITAKSNNGDIPLDELKKKHPQKYEELMEWLSEEYPDKALEVIALENVQGKGVGL